MSFSESLNFMVLLVLAVADGSGEEQIRVTSIAVSCCCYCWFYCSDVMIDGVSYRCPWRHRSRPVSTINQYWRRWASVFVIVRADLSQLISRTMDIFYDLSSSVVYVCLRWLSVFLLSYSQNVFFHRNKQLKDQIFTSPPGMVRSIAITVSACLSLCLSVRSYILTKRPWCGREPPRDAGNLYRKFAPT